MIFFVVLVNTLLCVMDKYGNVSTQTHITYLLNDYKKKSP